MPVEATPLFRPEVLRPRLEAFELPAHAAEAHERLAAWVSLLESPTGAEQKETELLPDFLTDVFQRILGYRGPANADDGRYTISREALIEAYGTFADAALGSFGEGERQIVVAVEGKGPKDPLDRPHAGRRMSAVEQAYQYAINAPCDWLVVTNIREIRLYHKGSTQRTFERFVLRDLASDEAEFRRFIFILGADRVVPREGRSHLYDLLDASEKAGERLTQEYYRTYSQIRHDLLSALLDANQEVSPAEVLGAAQRLLDRTLFVAFAEDRSLLPQDTLARAYEHRDPYNPRPIWQNFEGLFRAIDRGNEALGIPQYNGGLFAKHPLLDQRLVVPDAACERLKRLGDYHYGVPSTSPGEGNEQLVDVEILGAIFEQSIEDLEAIRAEIEGGGEATRATSRRRREGAFYTPAYVTRYIVRKSLRPILDERFEGVRQARIEAERKKKATGTAGAVLDDPRVYDVEKLNNPQRDALIAFWEAWIEKLKTVRAVDPACGSGAFLLELFDQLHLEYQEAVDRLVELRRGGFAGSLFDPDRTILQHNIYGVDLNEEAIEIARLSVWIKTAQRGKILTDLDHTIRVGNSIIDDPAVDARAFNWWEAFPEVAEQGGFDVVVGNPPYVRAEMLTAIKPHLQEQYDTYHGAADLYVYFYELGVRVLRPGGRMAYIVTNKWMKTGYAEPLRRYFTELTWVEEILDLGHAKGIFPDADVFPCILTVQKPEPGSTAEATQACVIPRDEVDLGDLAAQVARRGFRMPQSDLLPTGWVLEPPAIAAIMDKVRSAGVPLRDFAQAAPAYGIKTGLNEVFLVDTLTRDRLVRQHASSAEIIKPYLRGQDIRRWRPTWDGLWMIFARRGIAIERYPAVERYLAQFRERLEPKPSDWAGGEWGGRKGGAYQWYELQDTIDYWEQFERPKIIWKDLSYHSEFCFDPGGDYYTNDLCFILPSEDLWALAVLNSPLMWSYLWRNTVHGKDEVLRLKMMYMESLPIAPPTESNRATAEGLVAQLIEIAAARQRATADLHDWLRVEFGIEKPGQKLGAPQAIGVDDFVAEVKKRRSGKSKVSSAELRRLRDEYQTVILPMQGEAQRSLALEGEISDLVNEAYGLTAEEVDLLWRTAPPRMPNVGRPSEAVHVNGGG